MLYMVLNKIKNKQYHIVQHTLYIFQVYSV